MKSLLIRTVKSVCVLSILFQFSLSISPSPCDAQAKAYRIGPNDVLNLIIYAGGEKQYDANLTVSSQGTINAPFIGNMKAEGLTPTELEKKITIPLAKDYFINPKVNIHITEYHSIHYYISGAVNAPGLYETQSQISLLELIAKAGGVLPERGNLAYIMRDSAFKDTGGANEEDLLSQTATEPIKVDLERLLDKGDMSANLTLKTGDVVYIPLMKSLDLGLSKIYVEGEVKKPGIYDYMPGMTAMNACILAGGFDTFAAPNRTRIIRKKGDKIEVIKINLNDVKDGDIPDLELKPGDRIHVPESWL
jgi:polysaccharide export outer membrane protein